MHRAFVKLREKNCGVGFHLYLVKGLFQELVFFFVCLFASVAKSENNLYSKSKVGYEKFVNSYCSHKFIYLSESG